MGIVIAAKNAATTIRDTLESCLPAADRGARLLVVDGCSSDATASIALSFGAEVITHDLGLYAALNAGMSYLDSEWLTWINADDVLYADQVVSRLESAGEADVLYGRVDFIDQSGRFMHSWQSATPRDLLPLYRAGYSPLLQQGALFRRRVFDALQGFDTIYALVGDADFWWRALERQFVFKRAAHPPVAAFRLHAGQLSQVRADEMRAEHRLMVVRHGGRKASCRAALALMRLRGSNLPSYAVRAIRRHDLTGQFALAGSYSLSAHVASSDCSKSR